MGVVGDVAGGIVGSVSGIFGGGSVGGEAQSTATTVDYGISAGDVVALLPINNGQQYILLGRLVYLGAVGASQPTNVTPAATGGAAAETASEANTT